MSAPPGRGEGGFTLVELSIVMLLLSLVGVMAYQALFSGYRTLGQQDDETRGLADVKFVVERMGRDLRAARGIDSGADGTRLSMWIDRNADYIRTNNEIVTWTIQPKAGSSQFNVVRQVGTSPVSSSTIVGETLVQQIAFSYSPAPPALPVGAAFAPRIQIVKVGMTYDAIPGQYATSKQEIFNIRMRNVE